MAGVTKEEIALAKELDLLTYFKLVEPGNLKLVGKEYRHKVHSSLTISKDSLWCWHCIGLRGRTALKYLIDVEKVPYVEAVREINRIQGGVVHSSQPVSLPQPRAEPEAPRDFKLPNRYARLRLEYLEQNEPTLCDQLMLEGTLLTSCNRIGRAAQRMVDKTLRELMQTTQMPDRRTNPLGWTQMTNSLKKQAEEAVLPMLYEV